MILDIITPDKHLFSGEVTLVKVPGTDGYFEMMNNHAPIVSSLGEGKIKVIPVNGDDIFYNISGGLVELNNNKVSILVESLIEQ
jgi:F-type H+-transporting ATPase subunit epsilon